MQLQVDDLKHDLDEFRARAAAPAPCDDPPEKKARVEASSSASAASAAAASAPASAVSSNPSHHSAIDMDGDQQPEDNKEEKEKSAELEAASWLHPLHGARFVRWADTDSQPSSQWPELEKQFPRLALLARRFLCVLPTSAPSERVWSGFGHVIDKYSSTIDSTLAAKIMFLRHNKDMLAFVSA